MANKILSPKIGRFMVRERDVVLKKKEKGDKREEGMDERNESFVRGWGCDCKKKVLVLLLLWVLVLVRVSGWVLCVCQKKNEAK